MLFVRDHSSTLVYLLWEESQGSVHTIQARAMPGKPCGVQCHRGLDPHNYTLPRYGGMCGCLYTYKGVQYFYVFKAEHQVSCF